MRDIVVDTLKLSDAAGLGFGAISVVVLVLVLVVVPVMVVVVAVIVVQLMCSFLDCLEYTQAVFCSSRRLSHDSDMPSMP